ncbi:hypothetical protein [Pelagicoccus sp. SDUM812005]|uniref:hypothetical protein n=1 Tax=Pelagicoccus sp. SDUM812005 TaxID=3041257 RepID=UPI00280E395F|nr:hypothetical protein [Pelagicoccus sp. SDUM812005]MDQ8183625.1 hypothetical protein [Pelagicoccus sp. SDUM812005]
MNKKIAAITQADNWFFCQESEDRRTPHRFTRLSVWVAYEDGTTTGLLSTHQGPDFSLATPPAGSDGFYIHWDELNPEQKNEALLQGKIPNTSHPGFQED